jgi:hypothetical protein
LGLEAKKSAQEAWDLQIQAPSHIPGGLPSLLAAGALADRALDPLTMRYLEIRKIAYSAAAWGQNVKFLNERNLFSHEGDLGEFFDLLVILCT